MGSEPLAGSLRIKRMQERRSGEKTTTQCWKRYQGGPRRDRIQKKKERRKIKGHKCSWNMKGGGVVQGRGTRSKLGGFDLAKKRRAASLGTFGRRSGKSNYYPGKQAKLVKGGSPGEGKCTTWGEKRKKLGKEFSGILVSVGYHMLRFWGKKGNPVA